MALYSDFSFKSRCFPCRGYKLAGPRPQTSDMFCFFENIGFEWLRHLPPTPLVVFSATASSFYIT